MSTNNDGSVAALLADYRSLEPLLNYLRARLKYDTIRWLRTFGTKDDIVFSTRTKSFERVYDKLIRKGVPISRNTDILDIILSQRGILDDVIGIRFICFDTYNIFKLISYFLTTERVTTSERSFYISRRTNRSLPLYRFLQSNGFKLAEKEGREYEDINFILRFAHPIDTYFDSGLQNFQSLAQRSGQPAATSDRLRNVNQLFEQLKNQQPRIIKAISQFPMECQIVTATQHIYNRAQRPQYEFIFQRRNGDAQTSGATVEELNSQLEILKLNLISADQTVYAIHKKSGIQYQPPLQLRPGPLFSLEGRLPRDILHKNDALQHANDELVPRILAPENATAKRERALDDLLELVIAIEQAIHLQALKNADIASYKLLQIGDLRELSHQEIVFWSFQRIVILMFCVLLLYTPDQVIIARLVAALHFVPTLGDDDATSYSLTDPDIVIGRLFETVENIDYAIFSKIFEQLESKKRIKGWKDGYFNEAVFSDPLIQWRYASHMYSRREYAKALQELKVGTTVYAALDQWRVHQVIPGFEVPDRILFERRMVEYELCTVMTELRFAPSTVAGIVELCEMVAPRYPGWKARLQRVIDESEDVLECARCLCLQVLLRLCDISAGGLSGQEIRLVPVEFQSRFAAIEQRFAHDGGQVAKQRTWWLLATSIVYEGDNSELLEQFRHAARETRHHPVERRQFEELCLKLIEAWTTTSAPPNARNEFVIAMLKLVDSQAKQVNALEALNEKSERQFKQLTVLTEDLMRQLGSGGAVASHESLRARLGRVVGETAEGFAIDIAVSGIRSVLGI